MITNSTIPAAQYLRMSTDHQQYSLENQADAIGRYAAERGFTITRTYTDAARSGLHLRTRDGLKQLLKDVVAGIGCYRAVLVYDVSRWGRFQDTDESAYYEFICKSAGVPVHYCGETFDNDNSLSGRIMKALKRTMAGEYSRELSIKSRAGLVRLARNGFKPGGPTVYGMRRMLLDSSGNPKRSLSDGERKCIANERVILVPGSDEEITIVRRIFREFVDERRSLHSIANRLNLDTVPFQRGRPWSLSTVKNVLKRHAYTGTLVWGRTTAPLGTRVTPVPLQDWVIRPNAFEAIVDQQVFDKAQKVFADFTCNLSDGDLIDRLRGLLEARGKLTSSIIEKSRCCPGLTTYLRRFGGLLNVYKQLGYLRPEQLTFVSSRQRVILIRSDLIKNLVEESSGQLEEFRHSRVCRALLRHRRTGLLISVVLAPSYKTTKLGYRWSIRSPTNERKRTTVLALLDERNCGIKEIFVFRRLPRYNREMKISEQTPWIKMGEPLLRMPDLLNVVKNVRRSTSA
jgi:DNA invertase Pin-like site-specific DNA recombinase